MMRRQTILFASIVGAALLSSLAQASQRHIYKTAKSDPKAELAYVVVSVAAPHHPDPEVITVSTVPPEDRDVSRGYKLERVEPRIKGHVQARAHYAGAIPPGKYRIDALGYGAQYSHIWFPLAKAAEFEAVAGKRADLANLHISAFGGTSHLAYRTDLPGPDSEAMKDEAPELFAHGTESWPRTGWREPISPEEREIARENAERLYSLHARSAAVGPDGMLWLVADWGRVVRCTPDGRWSVVQAPQPMLLGGLQVLPDGSAAIADQRERRWRLRGDRFEPFEIEGFGVEDKFLHCGREGCLAVRPAGDEEIVLSFLPLGATSFREVARGKADFSDLLTGNSSMVAHEGRWYFEFDTNEFWSIDLSNGVVERKPFPHKGRRITLLDGKIVAWKTGNSESYTVDGGSTWQQLDQQVSPEQATAGYRDAKTGFITSRNVFVPPQVYSDLQTFVPLMRTIDGGVTWNQHGVYPSGRLVVGTSPAPLYVIPPTTIGGSVVVHVSRDDGQTWTMENITELPARQEGSR